MHLEKIGIRRSTAPSYKEKDAPEINHEKIFSLTKSTIENLHIYPNHRMLNIYTFALSKIKITCSDLTINKREKNAAYPMQLEK